MDNRTPIKTASDLAGRSLQRSLQVERAAVNEEARTVTLAFAGETPCERWYGMEILDCRKESIRMDRLTAGGPLLLNHEAEDQVGVVESVEIGSDKICRAVVRFGRSAQAEEVFNDILDGIRRHVSVGYMVHAAQLESEQDNVQTYRITDWEPFEVSIVSMPADFKTAGIGRSADSDAPEIPATIEQETIDMEEKDLKAAEERATAAAHKRVTDILAAGAQYAARGGNELAQELIKDSTATVETFRERMLAKIDADQRAVETTRREGTGHEGRVSVGLRYSPKSLDAWKRHGAKAEEMAYRSGQWAKAVLTGDAEAQRWCKDHGIDTRTMIGGTGSAGGYTVPEEMEAGIIDLRARYGVCRQLATIFPMNSGTLLIPKWSAGTTAYFPNETTATTESDATLAQVELVAKEISALTRMSLSLAEDAVIDMAAFLADQQAYALAKKEDDCWIDGDGTSTYGGMTGLKAHLETASMAGAFTGTTNSDAASEIAAADLVGALAKVPSYARMGARWLLSPAFEAMIIARLKAAGGGNSIATLAGGVIEQGYLGYPVSIAEQCYSALDSTDFTGKAIVFVGNFAQGTAFGERRGFQVQVLRERYAEYRQIGVIGTERVSIVNHGVGTTSSAGPICALVCG